MNFPSGVCHRRPIMISQHWPRWWLIVARPMLTQIYVTTWGHFWWHQAITQTNVDLLSKVFCSILLRAISKEGLMNLIHSMCVENTFVQYIARIMYMVFCPYPSGLVQPWGIWVRKSYESANNGCIIKTSSIRHIKSQHLIVSCLISQLSKPNPLKPGVK